MTNNNYINEIKSKLENAVYDVSAKNGQNVAKEIQFLVDVVEQNEKKIRILQNQILELTQEIENVRGDFGSQR